MNRNLTVKYQILLASNLQKEAARQTQLLENANARQQKSFDKTSQSATKMGQRVTATGRDVENAARGFDRTALAIQRVDAAMSRNGFGRSSLERTIRYLRSIQLDLDKVKQKAVAVGNGIQKATAIGVGVAAAGAAGVAMAKRPVDFNTRLANLSNVAYADKDVNGNAIDTKNIKAVVAARQAGMKQLEAGINQAVGFGGNRDDAMDALSSMISSGVVSTDDALKMLPNLQKVAVAADSQTTDMAEIAIRSMQNLGLTADQVPLALAKAMRAGQEGGFELKDMAKWLPKMMAVSKGMLGMTGMSGFEKLVSTAQTSVITAGSKDEAGNNLVGLLGKINSQDTIKKFSDLGVDLPESLKQAMVDGLSPIDSFANFVEQLADKNPEYTKLRKQAANATGAEQQQLLSSMADLMQGGVIGQVMADRESLLGLLGFMQSKDYFKNLERNVHNEAGETVEANHAFLSTTTGYKADQTTSQIDITRSNAFGVVEQPINYGLDLLSGYSKEHPITSQAAMLGVGAASMYGASNFGLRLLQGQSATAAGSATGKALFGTSKQAMLKRAGWLGLGYSALELGDIMTDDQKSTSEKTASIGRLGSGVTGGLVGAKLGAMIGLATGPAAPIMAPLLGLAGGAAGYLGADWLSGWLSSPSKPQAIDPQKTLAGLQQSQKVELDIKDGRLQVDVSVKDDRVQTRTSVVQQLSNINIDAGSTNPGGY